MVQPKTVPATPFPTLLGEYGDAGVFTSGVDTDLDTVHLGLFHRSIFEADGEGGVPGHHGPALGQEFACPGRVAGLERCVVFVQDEDGWVPLTRLLPNLGSGGDAGIVR